MNKSYIQKIFSLENTTFLIFATAVLCFYPIVYFRNPQSTFFVYISIFNSATLSLLCLVLAIRLKFNSLTTLLSEKTTLSAAIFLIFLISSIHFFLFPNYGFENYLSSLAIVSIPLFVLLNRVSFIRSLPFFILLLWFINLYMLLNHIIFDAEFIGIPGNRNWNAALIAVSTPFAIYALSKIKKLNVYFFFLLAALITAFTLYALFKCESRGANLAIIITGLLFTYLHLKTALWKKRFIWLLILAAAVTAIFLLSSRGKDLTAQIMADDARPTLWEGTVDLIRDHLYTGVGAERFESEFAPYTPPEHFLLKVVAVRHNHPHNQILYIAASLGIFGLAAWLFLIFYPLIHFFKNYASERNAYVKLSAFGLTILLLHGMLDVVLSAWPTDILALCFSGILWSRVWGGGIISQSQQKPSHILRIATLILLVMLIFMISSNLIYSIYQRDGMICALERNKRYIDAAESFEKARRVKQTPEIVYRAATNAFFNLGDKDLALQYLRIFERDMPGTNYAHNWGIQGNILAMQGHYREALPYLEKEITHYPLSCGTWFNLCKVYKILKLHDKETRAQKNLDNSLILKGLRPDQLYLILENPEYDTRPFMIPEDIKKGKLKLK